MTKHCPWWVHVLLTICSVSAIAPKWGPMHNATSCEWDNTGRIGTGPSGTLEQCQTACVSNVHCVYINWAIQNGGCELYSSCRYPWCRKDIAPEKWWSAWRITSRAVRTKFPPCAAGPPVPPSPSPDPSTASWYPSKEGWTGKIKPFWFGATHRGLESDDVLSLMARHNVAGYGWQTGGAENNGAASVGRGDAWGAAAVAHTADYMHSHNASNVTVFEYRQIQVALRLFAQTAIAADDPAFDDFWLHDVDSGKLCLAAQPWKTLDPFWNFSNATAANYWVNQVIGELTTDSSLTANAPFAAVFFDEVDQGFCGYDVRPALHSQLQRSRSGCNFSRFDSQSLQSSSNAMLGRMVRSLNSAGITPILSMDNRITASCEGLPSSDPNSACGSAPCAIAEDATISVLQGTTWVRFYENWPSTFWHPSGPDGYAAMIQNAILEGDAGVPNVLHIGGACPAQARNITRPGRLGGALEFAVASYLIVATPGTALSISNGWYDGNFCWHPEFDIQYGTPLGPPQRTGSHSWTRNYSKCNVAVDVSSGEGARVDLL